MRNKNYLYRQQRVQQQSHQTYQQKPNPQNSNDSNIFDIHFVFYEPTPHQYANTNQNKTRRKSVKHLNTLTSHTAPETITQPYPEIKMSLEPIAGKY